MSTPEAFSDEISIYPNPSNGFFEIIVPNEQPTLVEIFDNTGRRMKITRIQGKASFNISEYQAGTYIVRINGENKIIVKE